MATEVVHLRSSLATFDGDVVRVNGQFRLNSTVRSTAGTIMYSTVQADQHVLWLAAELRGVVDASADGIRVRLSNGIDQYYFDESDDMMLKKVTDTSQWNTEHSAAYHLASLDLWTQRDLIVVVHLISTFDSPSPVVKGVDVAMNFPAWAGAVAQCVKSVVESVATVEPVMVERFPFGSGTLFEPTQSFKIGDPHTEHGYELTSVVQVLVDGTHKSAELADGEVTLLGPSAPVGSVVTVAARYLPNTAVRRVGEVQFVDRTPVWLMSGMVVSDGLDGRMPPITVGGYEVGRRKVELRITINGIAHRQADALAMRLALQSEFGGGISVRLPSGRCVSGDIAGGSVEIVPEGGTNLPMASTVFALAVDEFPYARLVRNARTEDPMGVITPVFTEVTIDLPGGVSITATSDDFPSTTP